MSMNSRMLVGFAGALLATLSCSAADPRSVSSPPLPPGRSGYEAAGTLRLEEVLPEEHPGLANVFRLGENVISGGEPHGEAAIRRIAEMGVKTILSVDAKVPDARAAARHGMRYVHVPIRYGGISSADLQKIAKTFRELPGPFYVHCFHGKHRGPAAAAWGRIVKDGAPRERVLAEMRQWCGTSAKYGGLYETIARAEVPGVAETRALDWSFPSARKIEGFRQAMVGVSRAHDRLRRLAKRDFMPDPDHPDVSALNEAGKLAQLLEGSRGLDDVAGRPADFRRWLDESADHARALETSLRAHEAGEREAIELASAAFAAVRERCDSCHGDYRNE
jgi:protein tyrosine phosphatase (PTP) superfamily phosphohydrolase (DUF442 family)